MVICENVLEMSDSRCTQEQTYHIVMWHLILNYLTHWFSWFFSTRLRSSSAIQRKSLSETSKSAEQSDEGSSVQDSLPDKNIIPPNLTCQVFPHCSAATFDCEADLRAHYVDNHKFPQTLADNLLVAYHAGSKTVNSSVS